MALFATAFLLTVLALPPVRRAAVAVGAVDVPGDSRRMHHRPIPRMGGVGLALGAAGAAALLPEAIPLRLAAPLLCGGLLSAALGMTDDIVSLSPWGKLCGQACIALLPGAFGLAPVLPGGKVAGAAFSFALTLLLMNAVNLIDGLDGLAAGCVLLSGAALALARGNAPAALLCGGCLGFLPCNLPPARLFLGDAGSLFLGYGLAVALLGEPVFSPALLVAARHATCYPCPAAVCRLSADRSVFRLFPPGACGAKSLCGGRSPPAPSAGRRHLPPPRGAIAVLSAGGLRPLRDAFAALREGSLLPAQLIDGFRNHVTHPLQGG